MNVNIGDVVAWDKVPGGALVRQGIYAGRAPEFYYMTRRGDSSLLHGVTVPLDDVSEWYKAPPKAEWGETFSPHSEPPRVTIISLGLTGQESADDLRRLAEVFEVREALGTMRAADHATERALEDAIKGAAAGPTMSDLFAAMTTVAERLHAAGWRPGMTAEDAARLLAGDV